MNNLKIIITFGLILIKIVLNAQVIPPKIKVNQIKNLVTDSTRLNATGDSLYYYQNGVVLRVEGITGAGSSYWTQTGSDIYYNSGNVGIGNNDPTNQLTISGPLSRMDFSATNRNGISTHNIFAYDQNSYDNNLDTVNARFAFYVTNPNASGYSGSNSDGPYFFMSGNGRPTERGYLAFIAGDVSNPTGYDGAIDFATGTATRMRITPTGNVGIGTSSPSYPLEMGSGAHVTTGGVWTDASDIKLKENINYYYPYGLNEIINLKPTVFDYINGEKNSLGFIAQDVFEVIPEAISSTIDENGNETMGIKMVSITATLVKAIQEQQTEIDQLKTLITDLTNRLIILENK